MFELENMMAKTWCELNRWKIPKRLPIQEKDIHIAMETISYFIEKEKLLEEWNRQYAKNTEGNKDDS